MGRRLDASTFCCPQSAPHSGGRRFAETDVARSQASCSNGHVSDVLSIIVPALKLVRLGSNSAVIALRLHGKREFAVGLSLREKSGPGKPERTGLGLVTRAATLVFRGGASIGSMSRVLACHASW